MANPNDPLLAQARDLAATTDFYALLEIDPSTPKADIHRAWRKKGLSHHPDKAKNYDAAVWQLFEQVKNILSDDDARKEYDTARAAKALRAKQAERMAGDRRRFADELEAAEKDAGVGVAFGKKAAPDSESMAEQEVLRQAGKRKVEERERARREAEDRENQKKEDRIAEIEQELEERARRKAEKKAREGGEVGERKAKVDKDMVDVPEPDKEWRSLRGLGEGLPIDKRPIHKYTMDRLKAAQAKQMEKRRAKGLPAQLFVPKWKEVGDPEVRKWIKRVPVFNQAVKAEE